MSKPFRLIAILLILLLAGCGFRLRGTIEKPVWLTNVAITVTSGHQDLALFLKNNLQAFNVCVVPDPTQADYLLIIESDLQQQAITNVSASTTPRQYQMVYSVVYSFINKKTGLPMISSNTVSVSRQFTENNNRILGSDAEGNLINTEMRREAALQIINRISRK